MPKPWEKYEGGSPWEKRSKSKEDISLIDIPSRAMSNFPKDVVRVGKDIASAIGSPLDTMHSLSGVLTGAANLALPEGFPELTYYGHGAVPPTTGVEEARAVGSMIKEDYGGYENIKRTLADKPAQSMLDLLTLGTGGGAAMSKAPGIAGKIGRVAAAPGRAIAKAPSKALHGVSKNLYGQAMSWPESLGFKGRRAAIEVGRRPKISGGIPLTEKGVNKLQGQIGSLSDQLDDVLAKAEKAGAKTDVIELWNKVDDIKKSSELSAAPINLDRAVDNLINQHLAAMENAGKSFYTPKDLNTLKRALSERVRYSSAPGAGTPADRVLAERSAASVARETLEGIDPKIAEINAQLSPRMALRDPVYSAAFKGKTMSDHPIIAGGIARQLSPATASQPASLAAMMFGPGKLARTGIETARMADSPLLKALMGPVPATAYSATRLGGKKRKKKKRKQED